MNYIFIRPNGQYIFDLPTDADAITHADVNPGTLRVETREGRVVWEEKG